MTFDRVWLRVAVVAACIGTVPTLSHAGGVGFGEDDANSAEDGPSYFGFVREDGYVQANVQRRPRDPSDTKDPVEVECYLKRK
jgi:hypothetical protein